MAYLPHRVTVNIGTYEDLGDCDVIVNSIGKIEILRANQDRTDEMKFTVPAVNSYVGRVKASGFDGVVVNITNPCDVVTQQLAKGLGLPRGRVFGTGTGLDTSRLLSALARQTGIDHKSITAYMLGLLVLEKFVFKNIDKLPKILGHIYTFSLVTFGFIIFYFTDTSALVEAIKTLFGAHGFGNLSVFNHYQIIRVRTILVFILAIFACTPVFKNMLDKKNKMSDIIILVLFILSIVGILASSYNPFIYFRF